METLAEDRNGLGLSEIARRVELPRSTVHRVLQILDQHRMVTQVRGKYHLGPRPRDWATPELRDRDHLFSTLVMPYLIDLHNLTRSAVLLGVLEGGVVRYSAQLYGHRAVATPSRVRGWAPSYCTAIGKALLSHANTSHEDPAAQRLHLAVSIGEYVPDIACVAVTLPDIGMPIGIAVSDAEQRLDPIGAQRHLTHVAQACSMALRQVGACAPTRPAS